MGKKNKNKYGKPTARVNREELAKQKQVSLKRLNIACAVLLGGILFTYFCDFFNLDIDGDVQNNISGFNLSFILWGNSLANSDNILSIINKKEAGKIAFASVSSCITMLCLVALIGLFVYGAVKNKPLYATPVVVGLALLFVMFIVQTSACGALASYVEKFYYADCVTCIAQTLSYVPMIVFVVFVCVYFFMVYSHYRRYGKALQK